MTKKCLTNLKLFFSENQAYESILYNPIRALAFFHYEIVSA